MNVPYPDRSVLTQESIFAAIDIGTNSIHMVVVRIQPDLPAFSIIACEKSTVRLGDRDPQSGMLTDAAMERSFVALRRCQAIAQGLNADVTIAVATSAVREAPNGQAFLAQIEDKLNLQVNLISGPEEARRIYLGVLSGMSFQGQPHVIIDIGGGSTELILGDGHEPRSLSSTKIGAVRLTADFITTDPISSTEFHSLQAYIRGMVERPIEDIRSEQRTGETLSMIGTSGTIETLAVMHSREKFGTVPNPLNGYVLPLADLRQMVQRLRRLTITERAKLPGMSDRRAEIILAGALILQEVMILLGVNSLTICERSLREGVVVDWMLTHGLIEDRLRFQSSVRERSIYRIAQKYQVNIAHSNRVAVFALELFDQSKDLLHTLPPEARQLLWAAAILHNCGHHISHDAHHKHSYYLIRHSDLLGFNEIEIETIANLARYHRKNNPKRKHECYRNLTSKRHRIMVDLLHSLLRLAVALDRRQIGSVKAIQCRYSPNTKEFFLYLEPKDPNDDCALERWSLDYKRSSFELTYGVKLVVKLLKDA